MSRTPITLPERPLIDTTWADVDVVTGPANNIATDPKGNVFAMVFPWGIAKVTPSGQVDADWGQLPSNAGQLVSIATDGRGNVYAVGSLFTNGYQTTAGVVWKWTPAGRRIQLAQTNVDPTFIASDPWGTSMCAGGTPSRRSAAMATPTATGRRCANARGTGIVPTSP
ncbi:MAG: hypothetical protein ACPHJV_04055 [Miltoncostaeaceae bacterium]